MLESMQYIPRKRKSVSKRMRNHVFIRDAHACQNPDCFYEGTELLTIDHIIPVSKGGTNDVSNLQTLCFNCNQKKGAEIIPKS